jgi:arginine decarboxylase
MNSDNLQNKNTQCPRKSVITGCRIPKDFFITTGTGQSDITVHAGSYHLALKKAGIEMCNIMTYSSILPGIANEIKKPDVLTHGSVMETIMAVASSEKGIRSSAGVIFGWLYSKKTKEKFGGLVCEHNGEYTTDEIKSLLKESLEELYYNGFSDEYELKDIRTFTESIVPEKKYGTAVVALCFVNYLFPILDE